ncbi:MAG: hypothetical protein LBS69_10725 [Prevotellaceae bacterium]|jgi:hypothetical protein|nr:hypothetical protein [Prevotellaceae bacterium]
MRRIVSILLCTVFSLTLSGQEKPKWIDEDSRESIFPSKVYFTGFAYRYISSGESLQDAIQYAKTDAQADLAKKIRVLISSKSQSKISAVSVNGQYSENESFLNQASTETSAEVAGIKMESYYDSKTQLVYAFAYADKNELCGYYKAQISFIIQKIEAAINDARQFSEDGNKMKSKKAYETIMPMFGELGFAQSLLIAVEGKESDEAYIPLSLSLQSQTTQAIASLQTATLIYVESKEMNLGKKVEILAPKLKGELSKIGCSFKPLQSECDYILNINASTRQGNSLNDMCFSYLDAEVSLIERTTGKEIYHNNFTDVKGTALDYERAGRKAFENIIPQIVDKLKIIIQ